MRTVYLGTSAFAVAVLERLADSPHRPVLVVTRPDRPKGRGRKWSAPPVAEAARALGLALLQPENLHAPDVIAAIASAEPDVLAVCAYGALVKEPLLSAYEILNVHPSLLPRWRGAAPVERAIMAGDAQTGVSIMRLTAGLDSGPVCLQEPEPIHVGDDYGTLAARLQRLGGDLLVRALDERPPCREQDEAGVTYAAKIEASDRSLDATGTPEQAERTVRALRPHIGARIPLPDGTFLGVWAARAPDPPMPTLSPAGGRVRRDGRRLWLDCNGGALELIEIQPPGGRRMSAAEWLRGRPDPLLTDFWLDPALPGLELDELVTRAVQEWDGDVEWPPALAALCWRGTPSNDRLPFRPGISKLAQIVQVEGPAVHRSIGHATGTAASSSRTSGAAGRLSAVPANAGCWAVARACCCQGALLYFCCCISSPPVSLLDPARCVADHALSWRTTIRR